MKKNSRNKKSGLPRGMRRRVQQSGLEYYYFEPPRSLRRREIPLGSDYECALSERAQILLEFRPSDLVDRSSPDFILTLYLEVVVPTKLQAIRHENYSSISNLREFFAITQYPWGPQVQEIYRTAYSGWRGPRATIRTRREWSLVGAIYKWFNHIQAEAVSQS